MSAEGRRLQGLDIPPTELPLNDTLPRPIIMGSQPLSQKARGGGEARL